jgi:hypothetical protein
VLPQAAADSYDYGRDPRVAEALMNEREANSISAVAATLREEIIAGKYNGEDEHGKPRKVPSRTEIRERFGISPESGGVVLRMLTAEGLTRMEQGRGTFAQRVRRCRAVVTARPSGASGITVEDFEAAVQRVLAVRGADLADPAADAPAGLLEVTLTVIASDAGYAAGRASAVVRAALGEGWEISGAAADET